jgi:hypothetical protein
MRIDTIFILGQDSLILKHDSIDCINIITKCGESQDIFGISYDTIFIVSTTILIFIIGKTIDRLYNYCQEKRKIKSLRKLFFDYYSKFYENTLTPITKAFGEFYYEISIDLGIPLTPPLLLTNDFELINNNEFMKLAECIVYTDTVYKSKNHMYFAQNLMQETRNYHNLVLASSTKLREEIQNLTEEYINFVLDCIEKEKVSVKYDSEIWDKINERIFYYLTEIKGGRNLSRFYKEVLREIQNHLIDNNYFRTNFLAKEISTKGREYTSKYYNLRVQTIEIKLQYRKTYMNFGILQKKSKELLDSIKLKNWL